MTRQIISTGDAPGSPLYSQGVRAGDLVFVSGLVGIDPSTKALAGPTIQEQTHQALRNCRAVLAAAGATLDDVVEVGVLLTHSSDFEGLNEAYVEWFPADPPTRYVARLGVDLPGILVSIRMTASLARADGPLVRGAVGGSVSLEDAVGTFQADRAR